MEKKEEENAMSDGMSLPFGFGPIPEEIMRSMQETRAKAEMTGAEIAQKRYEFLEGLTPDQMYQLRRILNMKRRGLDYIDGIVAQMLRERGVDPETGLTPEAALAALANKE